MRGGRAVTLFEVRSWQIHHKGDLPGGVQVAIDAAQVLLAVLQRGSHLRHHRRLCRWPVKQPVDFWVIFWSKWDLLFLGTRLRLFWFCFWLRFRLWFWFFNWFRLRFWLWFFCGRSGKSEVFSRKTKTELLRKTRLTFFSLDWEAPLLWSFSLV